MTITSDRISGSLLGSKVRLSTVAPSLVAFLYPFALKGFKASVTRIVERGWDSFSSLTAAVYLGLVFAML